MKKGAKRNKSKSKSRKKTPKPKKDNTFLKVAIIVLALIALYFVYLYASGNLAGQAIVPLGGLTMPSALGDLKVGDSNNFDYNGKSYSLVINSVSEDKSGVDFSITEINVK